MTINCRSHGERTSAVVCRHHVQSHDRPVGFVENSDEPDDLQAWCDDCEAFFLREGDKTASFRKFNDFAVVCGDCYAQLKARHSRKVQS
jgi:L-arabinose isomerase